MKRIGLMAILVLILVLVEDGLGVSQKCGKSNPFSVLILVLVEDGLGGQNKENF